MRFLRSIKWPALLFAVALAFRAYKLPVFISYHQDQIRDLMFVREHLENQSWILVGPKASVGEFFLPPFWYYLMGAAYLFSPEPLAPALMVALLSSLTTVFVYLIGRKFFDLRTAIIASLLYAVSHLSIEYSRFSWNPNPIPLFVAATLYFCLSYYYEKGTFQLVMASITANLGLQLHYEGFPLIPFVVLTLLLIYMKEKNLFLLSLRLAVFALVNVILIFPFIYYEAANGFPNGRGLVEFATRRSELRLLGIPFFAKYMALQFPRVVSRVLFYTESYAAGFLMLAGISIYSAYLGLKALARQIIRPSSFLALFFILSLAILFFYKNSLIDYYLLFLVPVIIFLFVDLTMRIGRAGVYVGASLIALLALTSPAFGPSDGVYVAAKRTVTEVAREKRYCLTYFTFPPTYIQPKFEYLFSLEENPPQPGMSCEPTYYLCEPALCEYYQKFRPVLRNAHLIKGLDRTGVYTYRKGRR